PLSSLVPFPTRRSSDLTLMVVIYRVFRHVSEFCVIRTTAMARLQPQYRRPWIIHLWRGYDDSGNDGAGIARSYRSQYPSTAQNRDRKSTRLNSSHVSIS